MQLFLKIGNQLIDHEVLRLVTGFNHLGLCIRCRIELLIFDFPLIWHIVRLAISLKMEQSLLSLDFLPENGVVPVFHSVFRSPVQLFGDHRPFLADLLRKPEQFEVFLLVPCPPERKPIYEPQNRISVSKFNLIPLSGSC